MPRFKTLNKLLSSSVGYSSCDANDRHDIIAAMKRISVLLTFLVVIFATFSESQAQGDLLGRINGLRASLGLHPYSLNGALSAAAQSHAAWMATTKQISHNQPGGSTPTTRASAAGYPGSWVSENIYGGTGAGVDGAWAFWTTSPIHYRGLTNANYYDVGIGTASADGWNFFVLVFGNSTGSWGNVAVSGGGGNGGGGVSAAPSFIVGWDNEGNIMHEIQEGQTLGDIALIYGYTWADIPSMLSLNEMTDADIRKLPVGGVFLVPPKSGTYTPTAPPEGWASPTPNSDEAIQTAIALAIMRETEIAATQRVSVLLTPIFSPTPSSTPTPDPFASPTPDANTAGGRVATSAAMPVALMQVSPSPMLTQTTNPSAIQVAALPTPALLQEVTAAAGSGSNVNPLLVAVIVLQMGIIIVAGAAYFRGGRKK